LSTLSFAVGVAGDLSLADPPNFGERVVLRLPPELPADTVRAAALPALSTASADARPYTRPRMALIRARVTRAEYLVNAGEELELAALPKPREFWAGKPVARSNVA
jgi:hypothetical protein